MPAPLRSGASPMPASPRTPSVRRTARAPWRSRPRRRRCPSSPRDSPLPPSLARIPPPPGGLPHARPRRRVCHLLPGLNGTSVLHDGPPLWAHAWPPALWEILGRRLADEVPNDSGSWPSHVVDKVLQLLGGGCIQAQHEAGPVPLGV